MPKIKTSNLTYYATSSSPESCPVNPIAIRPTLGNHTAWWWHAKPGLNPGQSFSIKSSHSEPANSDAPDRILLETSDGHLITLERLTLPRFQSLLDEGAIVCGPDFGFATEDALQAFYLETDFDL